MDRLLGHGTGTPDERITDAKRVIGMAQYDKKLAKKEQAAPAVAAAKAAKAAAKAEEKKAANGRHRQQRTDTKQQRRKNVWLHIGVWEFGPRSPLPNQKY